ICHETPGGERVARFQSDDEPVWSDDAVELFLNFPGHPGYAHLAFNALGTRYDAKSTGGMNADLSWNPAWQVKAAPGEHAWVATVALPFRELGVDPAKTPQVGLSIKRTRKGEANPNSGWPDAAYHSP